MPTYPKETGGHINLSKPRKPPSHRSSTYLHRNCRLYATRSEHLTNTGLYPYHAYGQANRFQTNKYIANADHITLHCEIITYLVFLISFSKPALTCVFLPKEFSLETSVSLPIPSPSAVVLKYPSSSASVWLPNYASHPFPIANTAAAADVEMSRSQQPAPPQLHRYVIRL